MQAEQLEILEFFRRHPPLSLLPEERLAEVASAVEVSYFKAGSQLLRFGDPADAWYVIRSGAVEVQRRNGDLYNRLGEGGYFGEFGLLRNKRVRFPVVALEDTLIYRVPETLFATLFDEYDAFADHVEIEGTTRLRHAVAQRGDANALLSAPVEVLIGGRPPVSIAADASVRQAAMMMTAEEVSSLLVLATAGEGSAHGIAGIVTDRDLRSRVLAAGRDPSTPVAEVMTPDPLCVTYNQLVFEAMLIMLRHNVHHLPVLKQGKAVGVVALTNIIQYESQNSLLVVGSILQAQEREELKGLRADVRACFARLVHEDANSRMIGTTMAVIGRSFKQRLLELGEARLGPPPIPYCFLALGSMAREEQLIFTDQDNALVLDDHFDPAHHDDYFKALAHFVCDGLDACGYHYCTGGIMATNPKWRQPLAQWERYFSDWIDNPTPEGLLNSSIFFDLDGVMGERRFADRLNGLIRHKAKRSPRFLACMARNALLRTPPLGFFKNFVMEKDGRQSNAINMKRRGTAPLTDLIRVHALGLGSTARNSFERLKDIIDAGWLPRGRAEDLRDALELIAMVRIRHQALDLAASREPDNEIEPENLSDFERKNLKDAFQILSNAQRFLRYRYQPNRLN